jgi:hypothetical protein
MKAEIVTLALFAGVAMFVTDFIIHIELTDREWFRKPRAKRWLIRAGITLAVFGCILGLAFLANAGIPKFPGTAMFMCDTIGDSTGGQVHCTFDPMIGRMYLTYKDPVWFVEVWGEIAAMALRNDLCAGRGIKTVRETIYDRGSVRIRTIPCDTMYPDEWTVIEAIP